MSSHEFHLIVPKSEIKDHYKELLQALNFVEESREQNPELNILKEREKVLASPSGEFSKEGMDQFLVEEFIIRLLGGTEKGLSIFDIFNLIPGSEPKNRELVQRAIWDLQDADIILQSKERLFQLNPKIN